MGIAVTCIVDVYEQDGQDVPLGTHPVPVIHIESHRINPERVVLVIDGKRYTVVARDLDRAITNASNAR